MVLGMWVYPDIHHPMLCSISPLDSSYYSLLEQLHQGLYSIQSFLVFLNFS
jgi:hypothetical protein